MPFADEVAASELEEEPAIKAADGPEVGVFDLGVVAQSGGTGSGLEALLTTLRGLAFEQEREPVAVLECTGFGLRVEVLEAPCHSVKAEFVQEVEGGMGQHDLVSHQWK